MPFLFDSVPEEERKETARRVADKILAELKKEPACDAGSQAETKCVSGPQSSGCR
jgi:hypothetical protein